MTLPPETILPAVATSLGGTAYFGCVPFIGHEGSPMR